MERRSIAALTWFVILTVATAGWWVLAFWPVGAPTSELLERTRAVCFGTGATGLPDASGWLALILQPTIMFGLYFIIMGRSFEEAVRILTGRPLGRVMAGGYVISVFAGLSLVGVRVANASGLAAAGDNAVAEVPDGEPLRLHLPGPTLALTDQYGRVVSLEDFRGRPVMVTFAFGHCETVCPTVVHDALSVQRRSPATDPAVLIITLDPWRDLPTRLPSVAQRWGLEDGALVLTGSVAEVEAVLDDWQVPRARDTNSGDIVHPRLIYLLDAEGFIRYATNGGVDQLVELLERL